MRPLLRGPAGNDEEESSDSTPLLPSARQTEAGELRDHRVIASGSFPGGRVVPGRGRLEGVAAGSLWTGSGCSPVGRDGAACGAGGTEAIRGRRGIRSKSISKGPKCLSLSSSGRQVSAYAGL